MMSSSPPDDPDTPCPPGRRQARYQQHISASHQDTASHTDPPAFQQSRNPNGYVASSPPALRGGIPSNYSFPPGFPPSSIQRPYQPYPFQTAAQSSADSSYDDPLSYFAPTGFKPEQQANFVAPTTQMFNPHIMHSSPFPPATNLPPLSTRSFQESGLLGHDPFVSPRALTPNNTTGISGPSRTEMSRMPAPIVQAQLAQGGGRPSGLNIPQRNQPTPHIKQEPEDDNVRDPMVAPQPLLNTWNNFTRIAPEARMIATPNPASMNQPAPLPAGPAAPFLPGPPLPHATQGPPLTLSQRRFQDSAAARQYLERVHWRPITKSHGVPQSEDDRLPYVKKIYNSLIDISKVNDGGYFPQDKQRFDARSGVWGTDPVSIEAIAHEVVDICVHIHNHGVTGLPLRRFTDLQLSHDHIDRSWTFAQRIHLFSSLISRFKFCANHVMQSFFTMQYLARPWSTLMDQPYFAHVWKTSSVESQNAFYMVQPYENVPAKHPTQAEVAQFQQEWQQEVQLRNQRILQARQQHQNQQQQITSSPLAGSPPATTAAERAQQKVLEREVKRRKLNDSTAQAAQQAQVADSSHQEQASSSEAVGNRDALPAQEVETDWEQFFREHDKHEGQELSADDIDALFVVPEGEDHSGAKKTEGEDVVNEGSKEHEQDGGAEPEINAVKEEKGEGEAETGGGENTAGTGVKVET